MIKQLSFLTAFFFNFTYYYPLFMAYLWMTGALIYFFRWEKPFGDSIASPPDLEEYQGVSFLVPCHNESGQIRETIAWLCRQQYDTYEIIAINDGSTDDTGDILDELAGKYRQLRVIHLLTNQGKARGLTMAALAARYDYLICIDGDVILDPWAARWMVWHLQTSPRVAAVTGNPRIRNRSTLLGKVQVGEFSSIIGLIKRAQRVYGRVFTVSGAVVAFRRSALQNVGFWSTDMVTEDIDISWKLQLNFWDIRYEPHALCWLLMPETFRGLWKQRLRWAQGGAEVFLKNFRRIWDWKRRRMFMVFVEYCTSVLWAYSMLVITLFWALGKVIVMPAPLQVKTLLPGWTGLLLGITCLLQFGVSMVIDARYDRRFGKIYFWIIWYPVAFWLINIFTIAVGLPKALAKPRGKRATWKSPDRGIRS
ncbi:MAG TPA: poly-beta-1,6 N-acetyl-D-glucosamine synthase [Desulfobulbus sp.]|nr:poly-beta-1,6 N-acetyl-D-glucosamine synthase [Desulfobulbus sp.]